MSEPGQPVHPGKILLEQVMEPLGVSRNRLARDIDVPVGRISAIVAGTRAITADTALRLAKYFGTAPELWMRLQADYELGVARRDSWPNIAPRVRALTPPAAEDVSDSVPPLIAEARASVPEEEAPESEPPVDIPRPPSWSDR